jgi:hypothetical protein
VVNGTSVGDRSCVVDQLSPNVTRSEATSLTRPNPAAWSVVSSVVGAEQPGQCRRSCRARRCSATTYRPSRSPAGVNTRPPLWRVTASTKRRSPGVLAQARRVGAVAHSAHMIGAVAHSANRALVQRHTQMQVASLAWRITLVDSSGVPTRSGSACPSLGTRRYVAGEFFTEHDVLVAPVLPHGPLRVCSWSQRFWTANVVGVLVNTAGFPAPGPSPGRLAVRLPAAQYPITRPGSTGGGIDWRRDRPASESTGVGVGGCCLRSGPAGLRAWGR